MKNALLALVIAVASVSMANGASAQTATLKKNQIQKLSSPRVTCGYFPKLKVWKVAAKAGSKYKVNKKASSAAKSACSRLIKPGALKNYGLDDLPASEAVVAANTNVNSIRNRRPLGIQSVSGTPPTIAEIVAAGSENTFWAPGIVNAISSGTPTNDQCNDFFNTSDDGGSGGFLACYMTEGTAYSVSQVAQAGTSLCYMRGFPTQAVLDDGGVALVSGSLPDDDISKVFNTPAGSSPRVVKVSGAGESTIFIKIYSAAQNVRAGNQYGFDIWFCEDGETEPQEYERTRVSAGGEYISSSANFHEGQSKFAGVTRAFLRSSGGALAIDSTRTRTAQFSGEFNNGSFKSSLSINGNNELHTKVYDIHEGGGEPRKAYSIARFAGSGLSGLQFFEGAYKDSSSGGNNGGLSGAVEFRDSYYVAAPSSEYLADLEEVNFSTDAFYASAPSVSADGSSFSCSQEPTVELSLDMESSAMMAVAEACEGDRFDGEEIRFCRSTVLEQAQQDYGAYCAIE